MSIWDEGQEFRLHYEVSQLLFQYARGVDRREWDLVHSAFHDDAIADHGSFKGKITELTAGMRKNPAKVEQMSHSISNIQPLEIDRENKRVLVESHCLGMQRLAADTTVVPKLFTTENDALPLKSDRILLIPNRYLDLFTERDGELKIERRLVIYEWTLTADGGIRELLTGSELSQRSRDDATFTTIDAFINS